MEGDVRFEAKGTGVEKTVENPSVEAETSYWVAPGLPRASHARETESRPTAEIVGVPGIAANVKTLTVGLMVHPLLVAGFVWLLTKFFGGGKGPTDAA